MRPLLRGPLALHVLDGGSVGGLGRRGGRGWWLDSSCASSPPPCRSPSLSLALLRSHQLCEILLLPFVTPCALQHPPRALHILPQ